MTILNSGCHEETPINFDLKNISITRQELTFKIVSNRFPYTGTSLSIYSDKLLIYELPISGQKEFEVTIELNKLTPKIIHHIASLLSKNDSLTLSLSISANGKSYLQKNITYKGFKDIIAKSVLITFANKYGFNKSDLLKSDYEKILFDAIRYNKIYLNKIDGFNSKIPIIKLIGNSNLVCKLPSLYNYKIWLTDKNNKIINLTKLSGITIDSFKVNTYQIPIQENDLNGIYHLNILDDENQLTYLFPIINIDGEGPKLSLSKEFTTSLTAINNGNNLDILTVFDTEIDETSGYVQITHGNWESNGLFSPITLKVYVSGDVEKLYFDNEQLKFKTGQTKYITLNLSTHVGINAYEVKAIDKRGNISTGDYIIEAQSLRNNRTVIENNIENNINLDNN